MSSRQDITVIREVPLRGAATVIHHLSEFLEQQARRDAELLAQGDAEQSTGESSARQQQQQEEQASSGGHSQLGRLDDNIRHHLELMKHALQEGYDALQS